MPQRKASAGCCSCKGQPFLALLLQVVAQDQHVGSHLFAGCALMGQFILGIIWAGLMVSGAAPGVTLDSMGMQYAMLTPPCAGRAVPCRIGVCC